MTKSNFMCYYVNITSLRGTKVLKPAWGSSSNRLCGRLKTEYEKAKGDLQAARAAITTRFLAVTGGIIAHRTIEASDSRFLTILAQSEQDLARKFTQSAIQSLKNRTGQDTNPTQVLSIQSVRWLKQGFSRAFYALKSAGSGSSWRNGIVQNWQPVPNGLHWYWIYQVTVNSSNQGGSLNWLKTNRKKVKKFT